MMERDAKIFVAGANTMIGGALVRQLEQHGYIHILQSEIDLTRQVDVDRYFTLCQPEYVFLVAGDSGGIGANQSFPADLMLNNLLVSTHVIHSAHQHQVKKLIYMASSCVYPKFTAQPMQTSALMTDTLEPTNEAYATAKIAGIKLTQAYNRQYKQSYISVIPANNFGVGDDFDPENSHVVGALMQRMHHAKVNSEPSVTIWGTGQAKREFIYTDDLADACIFVMNYYDDVNPINVGSGVELSIGELATIIRDVVGYQGQLNYDTSKPDGMPLKMLDTTVLQDMGWRSNTTIETALRLTYEWYLTTLKG